MSSGAVGGGSTMERGFCLKMLKRAAGNTAGNVSYFLQNSKSPVLSETQSDSFLGTTTVCLFHVSGTGNDKSRLY